MGENYTIFLNWWGFTKFLVAINFRSKPWLVAVLAEMNIPEGPAAPTFSLGALATTESAPKKKAASKKAAAKKAEEEEVFDAGDDVEESAVHTAIKDDMLLKQVARALDSAPPCLLGLLPGVVFEKKVGHQIRGVPRLALAS